MKISKFLSIVAGLLALCLPAAAQNQWQGSKVAILGDSISDPIRVGTDKCWWEFLAELMDMQTVSFAVNGAKMSQLPAQALKVDDSFDAIIILAGTNDFFHDVPMGEWFSQTVDSVNTNGRVTPKLHRHFIYDEETFCGRCNILMHQLKTAFPTKQIILMTPLHRAFARFGARNVQPDEMYANFLGLYIEDYAAAIRRCGQIWSVPVIDLYSDSGLMPVLDEYTRYFNNADTDRLHPDAEGHLRMAKTIQYHLMSLPNTF